MTIRQTFLVLIGPLFLLLAGINGALLYAWERSEAAKGLDNQALAAAVTTAAFAAGADDLAQTLAEPRRDAALRAAARNVRGLVGLYVATPGGPPVRIAGQGAASPGRFDPPRRPVALPISAGADGRRLATALAPASGGRFVIAQIDAEPLYAEVAELRSLIALLMAGAAVGGFGLAWFVASRITREVARNAEMVAAIRADAPVRDAEADLSIRETRDLAHAVRLMKTGVEGRLARGDRELAMRDRRRDEAVSAAAFHEDAFPPLATEAGGVAVAVRMLGEPAPGAFYALAQADGRAGVVLGECAGVTPAEALAKALAARRFFERRLLDGELAARVAQGQSAFDLERVAWTTWAEQRLAAPCLALLDGGNAARARAYAERAGGLGAEAVAGDLAALLAANGVVAVLKASGEGGEG